MGRIPATPASLPGHHGVGSGRGKGRVSATAHVGRVITLQTQNLKHTGWCICPESRGRVSA